MIAALLRTSVTHGVYFAGSEGIAMFDSPASPRPRRPPLRASTLVRQTAMGGSGVRRRGPVMLVVAMTALGMLWVGGVAGVSAASAATSHAVAPAATQCDPPAIPTGAGFQVTCTIAIANTVTSTGGDQSTITATACLAAAGVLAPFGCTTVVTTSSELVTSVDQCNGVVDGGGSNVICSVSVVNTIPTGTNTVGVTVNQCIGSGTGGGTQPTTVCAPVASTSGATVTQCNGSGNGGGGSTRVNCVVTGGASAVPITINQCNGSSDGGGSTVICTTTFTNNFVGAAPAPTPTPTPTPTTTPPAPAPTTPTPPTGTTPTGTVGTTGGTPTTPSGSGSGVTGTTGGAAPAGGTTHTSALGTIGFVPSGAPQTGLGGAAQSGHDYLLLVGSALLIGMGLAVGFVLRRRRTQPEQVSDDLS